MTTPPFLRKLWEMVNDPRNVPFINWLEDGDGFKVLQPRELGTQILPNYFNGTMCSFIRQLNLYGFSKVGDEFAFKHHDGYFKRGQENLIQYIERRKNVRSKSKSKNDLDKKEGKPNKQQKTSKKPVKGKPDQKPKLEPETDQDPLAQLIHSHNAHDFMINWLTQELQSQQREIVFLREQLQNLTFRYTETPSENYNNSDQQQQQQFRNIFGGENQSTNRNFVGIFPANGNIPPSHVPQSGDFFHGTNEIGPPMIFSRQKIPQNGNNGFRHPQIFHPTFVSENANPVDGIYFQDRKNNNNNNNNGFNSVQTPVFNSNQITGYNQNQTLEQKIIFETPGFNSVPTPVFNSTQTPESENSTILTTPPLIAEYLDFEQYPTNIFVGLENDDLDLENFEVK